MFWIAIAIIIAGYLISKAIQSRLGKTAGESTYTEKYIKQLTEDGNKNYDSARNYLEMDQFFYKRWKELLGSKWGDLPNKKGWEDYNWSEANKKVELIKNIIEQFKTSLLMKEKFARLEEKYKFRSVNEKGPIYQDWADYARYFYNYTMGYSKNNIAGVIGYGNLVNDINSDDEYSHNRKNMLVNLVGRYDQIKIHETDSKREISQIEMNLVKMKEIEKRFQQRLKV